MGAQEHCEFFCWFRKDKIECPKAGLDDRASNSLKRAGFCNHAKKPYCLELWMFFFWGGGGMRLVDKGISAETLKFKNPIYQGVCLIQPLSWICLKKTKKKHSFSEESVKWISFGKLALTNIYRIQILFCPRLVNKLLNIINLCYRSQWRGKFLPQLFHRPLIWGL